LPAVVVVFILGGDSVDEFSSGVAVVASVGVGVSVAIDAVIGHTHSVFIY